MKKPHDHTFWGEKNCAFRRESEEGCCGRGAAWRMYWWRWDAGEVWDTGSFGIKEESIFAVLETLVTFTRSWVSHKLPIRRISPFHLSSPLQSAVGGQGWGQHITNKGILEIEGRCCLLKRNLKNLGDSITLQFNKYILVPCWWLDLPSWLPRAWGSFCSRTTKLSEGPHQRADLSEEANVHGERTSVW